MQFFKDFLGLFYPNLCINCTRNLLKNETIVCTFCNNDLPLIQINNIRENQISEVFYGKIPIHSAVGLLYFRKGNSTQKLIHKLKYENRQDIGSFLGNWFGRELYENTQFSSVDHIIPVPLHKKRLKKRGYNQLTTFGTALSYQLKTSYTPNILIKTVTNKTQTLKNRFDRFDTADPKFKLTDYEYLENKHVLLIDDIITTGATIELCCIELLKVKNIKISIATIAFTERT